MTDDTRAILDRVEAEERDIVFDRFDLADA